MGNDDEATFVALQGLDKSIDCIVIQMICGLIQQQNLRSFVSDHGERNSRFLTTGEESQWAKSKYVRDSEGAEMTSDLFGFMGWPFSMELFKS
jgi:hypothetical protein